jgi:hypothetical protein
VTLVLLWRVPERRVGLRWRGPAGWPRRSPANRSPRSRRSSAARLRNRACLSAPVDSRQCADARAGERTRFCRLVDRVAAPVIWTARLWRTFGFFYIPLAEASAWVPEGALLVGRFSERPLLAARIGALRLMPSFEEKRELGPFDPATNIVPGVGLTTGPVSTAGNIYVGPVLTSPAYDWSMPTDSPRLLICGNGIGPAHWRKLCRCDSRSDRFTQLIVQGIRSIPTSTNPVRTYSPKPCRRVYDTTTTVVMGSSPRPPVVLMLPLGPS